jgi:hypothetical protein
MYLSGTVTMIDKNNRVIPGLFHKELPLSPVRITTSDVEHPVWLGDILGNLKYITFNYIDIDGVHKVVKVNMNSDNTVVVVKDKTDLYGLDHDILEDMYQLCNQSMDIKVAEWIKQLR